MDLLGLKEKSAHKFIQNQLKKVEKSEKIIPERLSNIGIIVDEDIWESQKMLQRLAKTFQLPEPHFKALIIKQQSDHSELTTHAVVCSKDLKLFGKFKNSSVNDFLETSFDLLLVYASPESMLTRLTALRSEAKLKAGIFDEDFQIFDISVQLPEKQWDRFETELLRYLKILNMLE